LRAGKPIAKKERLFRLIGQAFSYSKVRYLSLIEHTSRQHLLDAYKKLLIREKYLPP